MTRKDERFGAWPLSLALALADDLEERVGEWGVCEVVVDAPEVDGCGSWIGGDALWDGDRGACRVLGHCFSAQLVLCSRRSRCLWKCLLSAKAQSLATGTSDNGGKHERREQQRPEGATIKVRIPRPPEGSSVSEKNSRNRWPESKGEVLE